MNAETPDRLDYGLLAFHVDPGFPNRWREEPWHSSIREASQRGLENGTFTTFLLDGKRRLLILPNKDVEMEEDWQAGVPLPVGENEWEYLPFDSKEKAQEFAKRLGQMSAWMNQLSDEERAIYGAQLQAMKAQFEQMRGGA